MSRYVDIDVLLREIHTLRTDTPPKNWYDYGYDGCLEAVDEIISGFSEINTIEIVRCKDCRYYQDNNGGYPHPECKWGNGETPDENDFCSAGERKQ